jgi:CRP-like cAMP-binding protein
LQLNSPQMTIIDFINTNLPIKINSYDELPFPTSAKIFVEGDVITDYHKVETKFYFINKGVVQISLHYNDDERIFDFITAGNFFGSYSALLTKQPSDVRLIALTSMEVEVVEYAALLEAYKHSLLANQLGRLVTERVYVNNTIREKDFLTKTAEQRYQDMLQKRPDLVALLPVHKIAKYLGIQPESLSRIRKLIIS